MLRLRTLLITALAGGSALGAAAPAVAHVMVERTSPKQGRTAKAPASASVTFSGQIRSGTLRVTGPGGRSASVGAGAQDPRDVTRLLVALRRGLRAGSYTARWTCVAGDGHRQHGSFGFRIRG